MSIIVLLLLLYNKSNSPKYFDERQLLLLLAILFISSSNLYYLNTYGFIKNQRYLYPDERRSLDSLTFKNNKQKCSSRNKKTYDDRIKEKANCNIENIEFQN